MNKKLCILCRGRYYTPQEYWDDVVIEATTELEEISLEYSRKKRIERIQYLEEVNERLNELFEKYCMPKKYRFLGSEILEEMTWETKIRMLESKLPVHLLVQTRPLMAAKLLRRSRYDRSNVQGGETGEYTPNRQNKAHSEKFTRPESRYVRRFGR